MKAKGSEGMLYREEFYPIKQTPNDFLTLRQAGKLDKDPSYLIERLDSETSVMALLESGRLQMTAGEKCFTVSAGQSLFLPSHTAYTIAADREMPPVMYWLNLRGSVLEATVRAFGLGVMLSDCFPLSLYQEILLLACEEKDAFDAIAARVFSLLLCLRSAELALPLLKPEMARENVYEAYICNHIQSAFSLRQMADELHTSTDAINRIFSKKYGITPYQYYQNIRIDFAKGFLKNSDVGIDDIAERLHFTDRNYFSLYFKKKTGDSPAGYRKKYGKKQV